MYGTGTTLFFTRNGNNRIVQCINESSQFESSQVKQALNRVKSSPYPTPPRHVRVASHRCLASYRTPGGMMELHHITAQHSTAHYIACLLYCRCGYPLLACLSTTLLPRDPTREMPCHYVRTARTLLTETDDAGGWMMLGDGDVMTRVESLREFDGGIGRVQ